MSNLATCRPFQSRSMCTFSAFGARAWWFAWGELKADHDALLQTLMEELPPAEARRVLEKYDARRKLLNERSLLALEATNPSFAAALDRKRPLIDPCDLSGQNT